MATISIREMADVIGVKAFRDLPILGFEVDSRKLLPGFAFFALKGDSSDGHDFLREAFAKGAICAVVSQEYDQEIEGFLLIKVEDVLKSLHRLAAWELNKKNNKCVAVTGSVGKTTTKEFIATLLEGAFSVWKTPGNANSQVGLPLSILNAKEKGDVFVVEMGMSSPGEIKTLLEIAPPDIAVVTKVALAHSLYFPGGIEEIALAKSEILLHPKTKKAFINAGARSFKAFQREDGPECFFYGMASDSLTQEKDFRLVQQNERFSIQKDLLTLTQSFSLPFTASHLSENFLAGALVARELGMSWELIFQQAMLLTPYKMRFERIEKKGIVYINDSYNANAESMKAALRNLPAPQKGGKVIAVLGEMRELGCFSEEAHREIGREAAKRTDLLLCLEGDCVYMAEEFSLSGKPVHSFACVKDLKKVLDLKAKQGDVVLIKASKSLKMWTVLEDFD